MKRELLITIITIFLLLALIMPKASRPRQVWATYNNTKIILNGIQISNQNAEPVTINSIVYLPVRTIPEALQMQIEWKADANTIYINSEVAQTQPDN